MTRTLAMLAVVHTLAAPAGRAEPALDAVLARAAAYVADFERHLTGIVADEVYVQQMGITGRDGQFLETKRRELKSDLLLIRETADGYLEYRDAYEVDGRPIRERASRFEKLFADDSPEAERQKMRIRDENARYNIGDIVRTINTPLVALQVLQRRNQPGFRFTRTRDRAPDVGAAPSEPLPGTFRLGTDVWVVEFRERQRGTLIRTTEGRDVPSRGRLWIEPDTGRVLMTEIIARTRTVDAAVTVSFKSEPLVGLLVPVEMRERYTARSGTRIQAAAAYGPFRQFRPHDAK